MLRAGALPSIPAARLPTRIFSTKQRAKVTSPKCPRYPARLIKPSCKACRREVWRRAISGFLLTARPWPPTPLSPVVCRRRHWSTTRGFRDVLEIRDGTKEDLWDAYKDTSPPYIRRRDRFEVKERIDYSGKVVEPLDERELVEQARILRRRGYKSIAVCFMNSYVNVTHERRAREILERELPGVFVSASAEIAPELFEHPRFSTAVINAVTGPVVARYIGALATSPQGRGLRR